MTRGLTLIEVVAGTALLTLVVLACVPILTAARADLSAATRDLTARDRAALSHAVDALLTARPGLAEDLVEHPGALPVRLGAGDSEIAGEAFLVSPTRAGQREFRSSHAWIVVRAAGEEFPRWVRLRQPTPRAPMP